MKNKKNSKIKVSTILLFILIVIAIVITIMIIKRFDERRKNEEEIKEVISEVTENIQQDSDKEIPYIEYNGYQVIGTIQIEKINIEYPILIESTEDTLKKSIARFGNGKVNEIGNLCLAGHNYINGKMFGKINKLENGDEISILDLHGNKVNYTVFEKFVTNPDDKSVIEPVEKNRKEITLITCIHGNKDRLIIRANEI